MHEYPSVKDYHAKPIMGDRDVSKERSSCWTSFIYYWDRLMLMRNLNVYKTSHDTTINFLSAGKLVSQKKKS